MDHSSERKTALRFHCWKTRFLFLGQSLGLLIRLYNNNRSWLTSEQDTGFAASLLQKMLSLDAMYPSTGLEVNLSSITEISIEGTYDYTNNVR